MNKKEAAQKLLDELEKVAEKMADLTVLYQPFTDLRSATFNLLEQVETQIKILKEKE